MGMTISPAVTHYAWIRQNVSMKLALRRYKVEPVECRCGEDEHRMECQCPLPAHPGYNKKKTFRIYGNGKHFFRWKCFSDTCAHRRAHTGTDVIAFVALMEKCSVPEAAEKILGWEDMWTR